MATSIAAGACVSQNPLTIAPAQYLHRKSTRRDMEFHVDFFIEMAMGDRELILDKCDALRDQFVYAPLDINPSPYEWVVRAYQIVILGLRYSRQIHFTLSNKSVSCCTTPHTGRLNRPGKQWWISQMDWAFSGRFCSACCCARTISSIRSCATFATEQCAPSAMSLSASSFTLGASTPPLRVWVWVLSLPIGY